MELNELIKSPEKLNRNTLYELRYMLALYPYFQTARLLMLHNLYLLHDPSFDEELRRAAIYVRDRSVLFQMTEAPHYRLQPSQQQQKKQQAVTADDAADTADAAPPADRTISLIDSFLETIPKDEEPKPKEKKGKRKPTAADAVDYVAYLLETGDDEGNPAQEAPQLKGQELIDTFINNDKGKIVLSDTPEYLPQMDDSGSSVENNGDDGFFTETLARIYIKQHRYSKALEIIRRLSLDYPKKNAYFADQIRFLEKLIAINNKNNK